MTPIVSISGLTHAFDERVVLDGVDLEIQKGEILAVMGSSGGGKTTLLRCVAGLIRPQKGQVAVAGVDVIKHPEEARRHMGMVFQSAALFDYLSVEDNILFGVRRQRRLTEKDRRKLVDETLDLVELEEAANLMPDELSGGMRKRVGIARALALRPEVMLYDEPTTGLDPITTYTIDHLICSLRKSLGVTSVIVSHDVSSVLRVADRVAFLEAGRLSFVGSVDEFKSTQSEAIRELLWKSETTELV